MPEATSSGGGVMPKAHGSATAATPMKTAAKPIMLCIKATNSGILVISTRCAISVPALPPITNPPKTQPMPMAEPESFKISAAVVITAMVIPSMPNTLPRIDVVGWLKPFKAWIKQMLATKYSSVTKFIVTKSMFMPFLLGEL